MLKASGRDPRLLLHVGIRESSFFAGILRDEW